MKNTEKLELVDTHCHIHDDEFKEKFDGVSPDEMIREAHKAQVSKLICVGTDVKSSEKAVDFCKNRDKCWVAVAIHPHEAEGKTDKELIEQISKIESLVRADKVVAIGECGLDYFYHDDPKTHASQERLLRLHLDLAVKHELPMIFHVRDPKGHMQGELGHAFKDFFRIIEDYSGIKGVMHSFSAGVDEMEGAIKRGFFIGLNGIMTFTREAYQLDAARKVPIEKLVLETDAPFLTPKPFRGKMCEPKHVRVTAEFLANLRGKSLQEIAKQTTLNTQSLFGI